ncbi:hypothetical protein EVAR_23830_1 [Eumeta japonica]|uniref:Uncharacterized protein n=1 Tax=Eumeta variegata TaxID=151549 RepID=A0A4C1VMU8_EUMVA|nr:hypothetical protein EVAR_23830_1 [Eumeta japonica]
MFTLDQLSQSMRYIEWAQSVVVSPFVRNWQAARYEPAGGAGAGGRRRRSAGPHPAPPAPHSQPPPPNPLRLSFRAHNSSRTEPARCRGNQPVPL